MVLKKFVRFLLKGFKRIEKWAQEEPHSVYIQKNIQQKAEEKIFFTIWDFLQFIDNTQAFHLINVLGFEEWVDMQEIRRRIQEIFGASYKNERSLYPYLKTLVDLGLIETSNVGGRRKWRKKECVLEFEDKKNKKRRVEAILQQNLLPSYS